MCHHTQKRPAIRIVDQRQLGLIGIERRPFLGCSRNRFTMQRHLRANGSVIRRTARVDVENRIEAPFTDVAMQIQPLARRANTGGRYHIAQGIFGDLHRVLDRNHLIDIVGMKKQRHGEAPKKTKIQPLKSVSHNFLILISCSSVNAGISEHATAASTCEIFENPTSTAAVVECIKPKQMAAWVRSFPSMPSAAL